MNSCAAAWLRLLSQDVQVGKLLRCHGAGRFAEQVGSTGGLGKGDHFADGIATQSQGNQTIYTQRDATMRRGAVAESLEQKAELGLLFLLIDAEEFEDPLLHISAMDADTTRAQLPAANVSPGVLDLQLLVRPHLRSRETGSRVVGDLVDTRKHGARGESKGRQVRHRQAVRPSGPDPCDTRSGKPQKKLRLGMPSPKTLQMPGDQTERRSTPVSVNTRWK